MPAATPVRHTSDLLMDLVSGDHPPGATLTLGEIIDALGDRAFGALLLIFALPTCVPAPPGLSTLTGTPILLFALQMLIGLKSPWLPRALRRKSFEVSALAGVFERAVPWVRRLEKLSRPRLLVLVDGPAERVAGLVLLVLALVLVLPIFLGNILPAIAIAIIGLALMEQDGIAMLVGYVAALVSLVVVAAVIVGFAAVALELFQRVWA
ncbi:MAG TPA: exopolysaccharide biosynthesis protein [Azospirillaceae bacterium]|nr:exopolysaccharide biosynthesis protein [Azospirillaceae bacterium]